MLNIEISNSLIENLIDLRLKGWKENLNQTDIFDKIRGLLIYDKIINETEIINWIVIKEKFQGIYISEKNIVIYFTQMLDFNGKERSRNTFISQNYYPAFKFASLKNSNISISINPFNLNAPISRAESIIKDIRTLLTLSVNFNKSIAIDLFSIKPFKNLDEYVITRDNLRSKNKGNNSTYIKIFDDEHTISVFGRLDGANKADTINTCGIISKFNSEGYNLDFFEIIPNQIQANKSNLKTKDYKYFEMYGFSFVDYDKEIEHIKEIISDDKKNGDTSKLLKRNQSLFIKNIIQKYIDIDGFDLHMCFACDNIIEANFIAAHIYRYADILRDYYNEDISLGEAADLITSGENGFFLCPNHDKEFEKGMIYFDINNQKFVSNEKKLNKEQLLQINSKIITQDFKSVVFNNNFFYNIKQHLKRIN